MRPCFNFAAAAAADKLPILSLVEEIGFWGMQSKDFRDQLNKVDGPKLRVEIDSPGGDVFAGLAMFNMLKNSGKEIIVSVVGVAASAASIVAMAGDEIEMPENTFMMVHNPWGVAVGNADEMRETADVLDKIGSSLLKTYAKRTGKSEEELAPMLAKDTWLTADECLEMGFATKVTDKIEAHAKFDMDRADLPENVRAAYKAKAVPPKPADPVATPVVGAGFSAELIALCKADGLEAYGELIAVASESLDAGKARISAAKEINALCALAKRPNDAGPAIRANKSVADVRAALVKAMAVADVDVDSTQPITKPSAQAGGKPASEVYAKRAADKAARRSANRK